MKQRKSLSSIGELYPNSALSPLHTPKKKRVHPYQQKSFHSASKQSMLSNATRQTVTKAEFSSMLEIPEPRTFEPSLLGQSLFDLSIELRSLNDVINQILNFKINAPLKYYSYAALLDLLHAASPCPPDAQLLLLTVGKQMILKFNYANPLYLRELIQITKYLILNKFYYISFGKNQQKVSRKLKRLLEIFQAHLTIPPHGKEGTLGTKRIEELMNRNRKKNEENLRRELARRLRIKIKSRSDHKHKNVVAAKNKANDNNDDHKLILEFNIDQNNGISNREVTKEINGNKDEEKIIFINHQKIKSLDDQNIDSDDDSIGCEFKQFRNEDFYSNNNSNNSNNLNLDINNNNKANNKGINSGGNKTDDKIDNERTEIMSDFSDSDTLDFEKKYGSLLRDDPIGSLSNSDRKNFDTDKSFTSATSSRKASLSESNQVHIDIVPENFDFDNADLNLSLDDSKNEQITSIEKFLLSNETIYERREKGAAKINNMPQEQISKVNELAKLFVNWKTAYASSQVVWNVMKTDESFDIDVLLSQIPVSYGDFLIEGLTTFAKQEGIKIKKIVSPK